MTRIACLLLALILAACGAAGVRDDSGTDGVVTNPCAENTRTIACDGDG